MHSQLLTCASHPKLALIAVGTCCSHNVTMLQKGGEKLGYESEAFAIYDTMRYIKPSVRTLCVGTAFGESAMLLATGEKVGTFTYQFPLRNSHTSSVPGCLCWLWRQKDDVTKAKSMLLSNHDQTPQQRSSLRLSWLRLCHTPTSLCNGMQALLPPVT